MIEDTGAGKLRAGSVGASSARTGTVPGIRCPALRVRRPLRSAVCLAVRKSISRGKIQTGTVEALVHAVVFAPVFLCTDAAPEDAACGK